MALEHIPDTTVEALDPAICPGGLWGCEAVPDVEGCTELIELMLTGGCPLAQAEQAICERFAVVCEDRADTDGASPSSDNINRSPIANSPSQHMNHTLRHEGTR